jgi:2-polyprenyl-3-methyl-5-hydroxy-6-metoxy-1,4-benzoquinol methylase
MLKDLAKVYTPEFFESLKSRSWRAGILCPPIYKYLRPYSIIDVGCGTGDMLHWFMEKGLDVTGIESNENCFRDMMVPHVIIADMRYPLNLEKKYDLAICVCMAEHVESQFDQTFIHNLTLLSDRILFASTPVNYWPHRICNCKPVDEWLALFAQQGFVLSPRSTTAIQGELTEHNHNIIRMVADNLVVLRKIT